MKNNEKRIKTLNELDRGSFLHEGGSLLEKSLADPDVSYDDHKQLFEVFMGKVSELFPEPDEHEKSLIKMICWTKHSKENPAEKKQTLREQLQGQIDVGDIHDASGKITPETLWMMICYQVPELKGKYELDSEYPGEDKDSTLSSAVVYVSASLAIHSKKTAHLRH